MFYLGQWALGQKNPWSTHLTKGLYHWPIAWSNVRSPMTSHIFPERYRAKTWKKEKCSTSGMILNSKYPHSRYFNCDPIPKSRQNWIICIKSKWCITRPTINRVQPAQQQRLNAVIISKPTTIIWISSILSFRLRAAHWSLCGTFWYPQLHNQAIDRPTNSMSYRVLIRKMVYCITLSACDIRRVNMEVLFVYGV